MGPIPAAFESFIRTLAEVEPVHVLAGPPDAAQEAHRRLNHVNNVRLFDFSTNDCWVRDYGPTFVIEQESGKVVGVHWVYTAWGGKYPPFDEDAQNAARICDAIGVPRVASPLVCEGGALETDGEGTLLTTTSCLQSTSRNPQRLPAWITQHLCEMLGVTKVIWLDGTELDGDDTDGHIDQLVRFVAPGRVVLAARSIEADTNIESLQSMKRQLAAATDARGRSLELIDLPTPPPRWINGQRVPESYCNFYIANDIVLVPTFQHRPSDDRAIGILKEQFSNRRIVPLDASDMIWGLGAFHCGSQQQPQPTLVSKIIASQ
jgi:agmatine deiminase